MKIQNLIRYFLAVIFLMTGIMKLALPDFGNAFRIQLEESNIPMVEFNLWFVPIIELAIGFLLLINFKIKWGLLFIIPTMIVALYVHLVVDNPLAFPAQPQFPIMPIMVLGMTIYLLIKNNFYKWQQ